MSQKVLIKNTQSRKIEEDNDIEETEILMPRSQVTSFHNRIRSAEGELTKVKVERDVNNYKYQQSLGIIEDLSKKVNLLQADLESHKRKKNIKDTDLKLYDIDMEANKKDYDKRFNEGMKVADKEIALLRQKFLN